MYKTLVKGERVKIAGQWRTVDVVLTGTGKRKRIEYVDADGYTLDKEPYSRSKYKDTDTAE